MIALAGLFLIPYGMLVFTNGAIVIVLVFPVLIGLMIYLNSVVVGLGCIYAFVICAVKCFLYKQAGDIEFYNYTNLITICFVVSVYGSYRAISLLINFSKEVKVKLSNLGRIAYENVKINNNIDLILDDIDNLINKEANLSIETIDYIKTFKKHLIKKT